MRGTFNFIIFLMILGWVGDGWARVCGQQITDAGGRILLPHLYDHVSVENDAEFVVWDGVEETCGCCDSPAFLGGKAGLYSVDGALLLPVIYDGIFPLAAGVYKINQGGECTEQGCQSGLWALYFTKKRHLTAFAYSEVEKLENHPSFLLMSGCDHRWSRSRSSCRYGLMTPDGFSIPPVYEALSPTPDGRYLSVKLGGRGAFLDRKGQKVPLPENDRTEYLGEDRFAAHHQEHAALFTAQGRQLTSFILSQVRPFQAGTAAVRIGAVCGPKGCSGGKWHLIDRSARPVAGPFEDLTDDRTSVLLIVSRGGQTQVMDHRGKFLVPQGVKKAQFDIYDYREGAVLQAKTVQGKTILFNGQGHLIYEGGRSEVMVHYKHIYFRENKRIGVISRTGDVILPAVYEDIFPLENGFFELKVASRYGLADPTGKVVMEARCERLKTLARTFVCENPTEIDIYDYQGRKLHVDSYDTFDDGEEGASSVCRRGQCSRLREDGAPAFSLPCRQLECSRALQVCVCEKERSWSAVDFLGKEIFSGPFQRLTLGEGFLVAYQGGRCVDGFGCMNGTEQLYSPEGKKIAQVPRSPFLDHPKFYHQKVCTETCEDRWVLLDRNARELVQRQYDLLDHFVDGFARVSRGARPHHNLGYASPRGGWWGIIDVQGREVLPLKYGMVSNLEEGLFRVNEGGICSPMDGCSGGVYKILDPSGRVVSVLKGYQAETPIRGGALLVTKGERNDVNQLIDLRGRVLHTFLDRIEYEEGDWIPFQRPPWIFEDWSAVRGQEGKSPWLSVSGRPVGSPRSVFRKLGEGGDYKLWSRLLGEPTQHTVYTREGKELLQVACGEFLTTGTHFACEAFRGTQRTGFLRLFDGQGKAVCALPLFHRGSAAPPVCGPEVGVRTAAAGETAYQLVAVVLGHFLVRDAAGRFAALTPDGKWASGFGGSWRIPTGEPGVFYTDPTTAGGAWNPEKPRIGLVDATGRALTAGGYEDLGPFSGGLARVRLPAPTPNGEPYDGLIDTQGKVRLDDPKATVVHLEGGTALVETSKNHPGTESRVWTVFARDAQGRETARFADAQVQGRGTDTKALGRVFVLAFHGDCRVFPGRRICRKKTYGLIDAQGKILLKDDYAALELLGDGLLAAKKAVDCRKWNCADVPFSILNLQGQPVSALTYESVSPLESGGRVFTARRCVK